MDSVMGVVIFIGVVFVYFLPSIVALAQERVNLTAIFVLNLLLGWTFVGWVVALVWACTSAPKPSPAQ